MNDIVPHIPPTDFNFNHAGDEVWYDQSDQVGAFVVCKNKAGQVEDPSCSDTYYMYDPGQHTDYLGIDVVGQCTTPGSSLDF